MSTNTNTSKQVNWTSEVDTTGVEHRIENQVSVATAKVDNINVFFCYFLRQTEIVHIEEPLLMYCFIVPSNANWLLVFEVLFISASYYSNIACLSIIWNSLGFYHYLAHNISMLKYFLFWKESWLGYRKSLGHSSLNIVKINLLVG